MENVKFLRLGDIANVNIMKGLLLLNNRNEASAESEEVKILKYINVKDLVTFGNTKEVEYSKLDLSRKYKDCDVRKGDIVVPLLARKDKGSALYIEKESTEKCIYNESNLIIRIENEAINNRYIALVIDRLYQKWFEIETAGVLPFRVTVNHLKQAVIPLPTKEVQDEIVNDYIGAINRLKEVDNKIEDMIGKGG